MLLAAIAMLLIGLTLGIWAASLVLRVLDEHLAALGQRWFPSLKPRSTGGPDSAVAPFVVRPWQKWFAATVGTLAMLASPVILRQAYLFGTEDALGNPRGSLWDWWLLGAALSATLGFAAFLLALRFDTPRGRRRCGKCWYDYTGLADTAACPECGRVSKNSADLRRTRGHRGMGWLAVLLLVSALGLWRTPAIMTGGAVGGVPTTVLIFGMGVLPPEWVAPAAGSATGRGATLRDRIADRQMWSWQRSFITGRTMRVMQADDSNQRMSARACFDALHSNWNQPNASQCSPTEINALLAIAILELSSENPLEPPSGATLISAIANASAGYRIPEVLRQRLLQILRDNVNGQQRSAITALAMQPVLPAEDLRQILSAIGATFNADTIATPLIYGLVVRMERYPEFEASLLAMGEDENPQVCIAAMSTLAATAVRKADFPSWLRQRLRSPHPIVVNYALAMARQYSGFDQTEMIEPATQIASVEGPSQTHALAFLSTHGALSTTNQFRCIELIHVGNADEWRRAAACLVYAWPLDPLVTAAIAELRDSGMFPECAEMPERQFLDHLRTGIQPRPQNAPPLEPMVIPR